MNWSARPLDRIVPSPYLRRGGSVRLLGAVLVAAACAWQPSHAQPQAPSRGSGQSAANPGARDLARFVSSVVQLNANIVRDGRSVESLGASRTGTGVLLDDRTVLTIGYLIMEAESVEVRTASGQAIPASVMAYDHGSGFGLVRTALPVEGQPLELGDSDRIGERTRVLTIGQGEPEATPLLVLSRRPFAGNWEYLVDKALYTFPPVNNWSGAALMSEDGKLIGIGSLIVNDAATTQSGVPGNMYVPINALKPILAELRTNGRVKQAQPWLGLTTEVVRGNVMVTRVAEGGPAEAAGVSPGDILLGVGGEKVADQQQLYRRIWATGPAGVEVPVRLLKDGDVRELRIRSIDRNEFLRKPSGI